MSNPTFKVPEVPSLDDIKKIYQKILKYSKEHPELAKFASDSMDKIKDIIVSSFTANPVACTAACTELLAAVTVAALLYRSVREFQKEVPKQETKLIERMAALSKDIKDTLHPLHNELTSIDMKSDDAADKILDTSIRYHSAMIDLKEQLNVIVTTFRLLENYVKSQREQYKKFIIAGLVIGVVSLATMGISSAVAGSLFATVVSSGATLISLSSALVAWFLKGECERVLRDLEIRRSSIAEINNILNQSKSDFDRAFTYKGRQVVNLQNVNENLIERLNRAREDYKLANEKVEKKLRALGS